LQKNCLLFPNLPLYPAIPTNLHLDFSFRTGSTDAVQWKEIIPKCGFYHSRSTVNPDVASNAVNFL